MKLSISNIAWISDYDDQMYKYLCEMNFTGLEIAPTRIFSENPYDKLEEAKTFSKDLKQKYNLEISSMQSIWYGKSERIFGTVEERDKLVSYTKKAIDFASTMGCRNMVLGSPKNRIIDDNRKYHIAVDFFRELGQYAAQKSTVLSIEPNPTLYGTNFINFTQQAFEIVNEVNSSGFKVNVDFGTIIQNDEGISMLEDNFEKINHIHISEPNLMPIIKREGHKKLANMLKENGYNKFLSIEMKKLNNIEEVKKIIQYVKEVFE